MQHAAHAAIVKKREPKSTMIACMDADKGKPLHLSVGVRSAGHGRHRIRLHRYRRRLGRRSVGGEAERGPRPPRPAARGRTGHAFGGHARAHQHPQPDGGDRRRRLSLAAAHGPAHRTATAAAVVARPGHGRQLDHQRPDRHSRRARRFRPMGGGRLPRLGLGGPAAVFLQARDGQELSRGVLSRRGWPDPGLSRADRGLGRRRPGAARGGAGVGLRLVRGPQCAAGQRRVALRHQQHRRAARVHQRRLPGAGAGPGQPHDRRRRPGGGADARRQSPACSRRARPGRRPGNRPASHARRDPMRGRHPLPRHTAALRHRPGGAAARSRHPGRGRQAGRRGAARPSDGRRDAAPPAARAGRHPDAPPHQLLSALLVRAGGSRRERHDHDCRQPGRQPAQPRGPDARPGPDRAVGLPSLERRPRPHRHARPGHRSRS